MTANRIIDAVKTGKILFSDGAWGTFLQKKGLKPGQCPELWCIDRPDDVFDIAKSYVQAGSDMVETNSFGGSIYKLQHFGLDDRVEEINSAAAAISRKAIGPDGWVIASVGPTGKLLLMGDVTEDDLYNCFKQQITALEKGGANAVCIETMTAIDEATLAIKAARENTNLEIICTFTFDRTQKGTYRTMMGTSPQQATEALTQAGADIIGTNCGNGFAGMIDIVKEMRQSNPEIPIMVQANAGLPKNIDGVDIFPESPEDMALQVNNVIAAGANIIGGCCGSTPEHIQAMKNAVKQQS